jgi:hypothetical protein
MPGIAPPCANAECQHPQAVHKEGEFDCRVTGCLCQDYQTPAEESEEPGADGKRLVIEIPDGFAVTVQLMPLEPS